MGVSVDIATSSRLSKFESYDSGQMTSSPLIFGYFLVEHLWCCYKPSNDNNDAINNKAEGAQSKMIQRLIFVKLYSICF